MVLLRHSNMTIDQAADAAVVFQALFAREDKIDRDKEHFYVMHLDSKRHITRVELVAIGILTDVKSTREKHTAGQSWKAQTASLLPTTTPQAMSAPLTQILA
jgi:hypothetical protein